MNIEILLSTILELPPQDLQTFLSMCLSDRSVMERMHLFLLLQSPEYIKKLERNSVA